eukprot:TRINITY_DN94472_c0_g1_i1.p1 TRINITY_DN94472_c0_g1~~TRINITY_DN94472_c0_g1_i1.p1  ORF type:complete len:436 (-),score=7.66 TRINITY_DN94472_c0_g1_i1:337-1545(-)
MTMGSQWVDYHGFSATFGGFTIIPSFIGMSLLYPFVFRPVPPGKKPFHKLMLLETATQLSGNAAYQLAIIFAGSQLLMVIYSSVTIWAAVFRRAFLKRKLLFLQWVSLVIIFMGLGLGIASGVELGSQVVVGIMFAFAAAMIYGVNYVTNETLMTIPNAPPAENVVVFDGVTNMFVMIIWIFMYDGPKWAKEVTPGDTKYYPIIFVFIGIALSNMVHMWSFMYASGISSAVASGVNKSAQSVTIFITSLVFCQHAKPLPFIHIPGTPPPSPSAPLHTTDCFTGIKGASLAVVTVGVLTYSMAPNIMEKLRLSPTFRRIESACVAFQDATFGRLIPCCMSTALVVETSEEREERRCGTPMHGLVQEVDEEQENVSLLSATPANNRSTSQNGSIMENPFQAGAP